MLLLGLALTVATPVMAQGQGGRGRGMMMGPAIEDLKERLKLDSSQVEKIKPMIEKFVADTKGARETMQANMQAVRNGETTRDAVQAENQAAMMVIRDHRETLNQGIKAVLTPEQQKEFDAWLAEQAERMQRMQRPPNSH
jgi:Spy/CpxP family protein refolding chaperone